MLAVDAGVGCVDGYRLTSEIWALANQYTQFDWATFLGAVWLSTLVWSCYHFRCHLVLPMLPINPPQSARSTQGQTSNIRPYRVSDTSMQLL